MSLEKLKQTLNYIKNVTEEDSIYDAAEAAIKHLTTAEVELQNKKSVFSVTYSPIMKNVNIDFKSRFEDLKKIVWRDSSWDEQSDLRAKLQDLWDEVDEYTNSLSTLADEISSYEEELEDHMDDAGESEPEEEEEEDHNSDDFYDQLD